MEKLNTTSYDIFTDFLKMSAYEVSNMSPEDGIDFINSLGDKVIYFSSTTTTQSINEVIIPFLSELHSNPSKELIEMLKIESIYELITCGEDYDVQLEMEYKYTNKRNPTLEARQRCSEWRYQVMEWNEYMHVKIQDLQDQLPNGVLPSDTKYKFVIDYKEDGTLGLTMIAK
jgi:hypothetical protein